jgi:Zn-dependent oligopeptidase
MLNFFRIKTNIKPEAEKDIQKLQKYSSTEGNLTSLEQHDLDYWKEKHTEHYFGY